MKGPLNCTNSELSTYLRVLAAGCLPTSYLDTNASAPSKSIHIASKSYRHGKKTVSFPGFQSSVISRSFMADHGRDWLRLLPAGFLAKISAHPVIGRDFRERNLDYGQNKQGWFAKWNQPTCSWKTPQPSLFEELISFSPTWPKWGSMQNGVCWVRPTPSGLMEHRRLTMSVLESSSRLPTPTVSGNYNRKGASKTSGDGLATALRRLPTPVSSDIACRKKPTQIKFTKTGMMRNIRDTGKQLRLQQVLGDGGPLNPQWVEWFMGWTIGMTGLRPLEMDKFHQWLRSHGITSNEIG